MATQIQLRRDTSENWTNANPVLSEGEIGVDLTTGQLKIGNGSTAWVELPYYGVGVIDNSNLQEGSVLVYKTETNKWTSTLNLEDQVMNGGFF
jgi:hypothetical protein